MYLCKTECLVTEYVTHIFTARPSGLEILQYSMHYYKTTTVLVLYNSTLKKLFLGRGGKKVEERS